VSSSKLGGDENRIEEEMKGAFSFLHDYGLMTDWVNSGLMQPAYALKYPPIRFC